MDREAEGPVPARFGAFPAVSAPSSPAVPEVLYDVCNVNRRLDKYYENTTLMFEHLAQIESP